MRRLQFKLACGALFVAVATVSLWVRSYVVYDGVFHLGQKKDQFVLLEAGAVIWSRTTLRGEYTPAGPMLGPTWLSFPWGSMNWERERRGRHIDYCYQWAGFKVESLGCNTELETVELRVPLWSFVMLLVLLSGYLVWRDQRTKKVEKSG